MTDKYFELLDHINQVVQFINENGGSTVIGWYKCGVINDHVLIGDNGSAVGSSNSNINCDKMNRRLNEMKFPVQTIDKGDT
eukprot:6135096-Ditylum_brightwellii.AAC.1